MARPKIVAAAPGRGNCKAQGNHVVYPTLMDIMKSRGLSPGVRGVGAKQAVKLENARVAHMRAEIETTWQEDHSGVEHAGHHEDKLEKKPSLVVGGGSSSVNVESYIDREDLAGSDQDLASEEGVHGCVMPQGTQNFGKHDHDAEFVCTACGRSVAIVDVQAHPVLHVGVCENCYDFLFSSPFTKDNPQDPFEHENECRWCGDGGEVILCDTCPKAFCKPCIKRNFGEDTLNAIESPTREWSCFVCDDDHLQTLIRDYSNVENLVKTMNRSGQPRKSKTSRKSNSQMGSRRRFINKTTFASDTIATIIAREKANLQRKYPEKNFTGFEKPKQDRHPQHHFLFAKNNTNNTKCEYDTSERGEPIPEYTFCRMALNVPKVVQQNFQEHERQLHGSQMFPKQDSKQESE